MNLILCLQVSPKDVFLGLRLIRLIVAIERKRREDIQFIVSARRDTNPVTVDEILATAKRRFPSARLIRGKRFGTGWPLGCNDLWQETMMRVAQGYDAGFLQADGVLTFESDCLPLLPDWIDRLVTEWKETRAQGKFVCGHAHGWPEGDKQSIIASIGESISETSMKLGAPTHINGNAIFHAKVTDFYPELNGCDARTGWDAYHGQLLLAIGRDTDLIYQRYRIRDWVSNEYIQAIRKNGRIPALFHGIKGESGLAVVESMVEDGSFFNR